jgi:hypothetical protein
MAFDGSQRQVRDNAVRTWFKPLSTTIGFLAFYYVAVVFGWMPRTYEIANQSGNAINAGNSKCDLVSCIALSVVGFLDAHGGFITAAATVAIAWFTWKLWSSTSRQAELTRESIDLARDEFRATHRPRVKILNCESNLESENTVEITIYCVNAGDTPAVLLNLTWRLDISDKPVRKGDVTKERLSARKLAPGEIYQHTIKTTFDGDTANLALYMALKGRNYFLFFIGRIGYDDPSGNGRATGCHRVYDPTTESWTLVKNSDYEYSY